MTKLINELVYALKFACESVFVLVSMFEKHFVVHQNTIYKPSSQQTAYDYNYNHWKPVESLVGNHVYISESPFNDLTLVSNKIYSEYAPPQHKSNWHMNISHDINVFYNDTPIFSMKFHYKKIRHFWTHDGLFIYDQNTWSMRYIQFSSDTQKAYKPVEVLSQHNTNDVVVSPDGETVAISCDTRGAKVYGLLEIFSAKRLAQNSISPELVFRCEISEMAWKNNEELLVNCNSGYCPDIEKFIFEMPNDVIKSCNFVYGVVAVINLKSKTFKATDKSCLNALLAN